MPPVDTSEN